MDVVPSLHRETIREGKKKREEEEGRGRRERLTRCTFKFVDS